MQKTDRLYQETLIRVGKDEMAGIDSLLDKGHTGIAERHAVQKMVLYVRELENRLGLDVPKATDIKPEGTIKVNTGRNTFYL